MDFNDTAEEAQFRKKVRDWIDANAPKELEGELSRAAFGTSGITSQDPLAASKSWQRKKADAGYACPRWPKEYGGAGFSPIESVIWSQEEGPYAALSAQFTVGHGMCGPTMIEWASEEQKGRHLPPLSSGEEIWCQLFSEPAAGSDLAGIRTRAQKDGDDWIVNGQKIWTSAAHLASYGLLLTRTDPDVPKHKGLTMFFLDMRSPGVEVRPIKQANGRSGFNEVYFTDVRIPDAQRLGAPGAGWQVALTTLMNERLSLGSAISVGFPALLDYCKRLKLDGKPATDNPMVRARLAKFAVRDSGLKYTAFRAITALSKGKAPGPENSIGKLVAGLTMQELAMFALDLQGQAGVVGDEADGFFQTLLMRAPAIRIEGGTDEILRNIIGERVLGLPQDLRADQGMAFRDIPTRGHD